MGRKEKAEVPNFEERCIYIPLAPKDSDEPKGPNRKKSWEGPTVTNWSPEGKGCSTWKERQRTDWERWGVVDIQGNRRLLILDFDLYKMDEEREEEIIETINQKAPQTRVHESQSGGLHLFYLVNPQNLDARFTENGNVKGKLPVDLERYIDDKLNGYVVAPDCEGYEVKVDMEPVEIDPRTDLPKEWLKTGREDKKNPETEPPGDEELGERLEIALEKDEKFELLYSGEYEEAGFDDRSSAEASLASKIGFWFGRNEETIEKMMEKSGAKKWHQRDDRSYRDSIISVGLQGDEEYTPRKAELSEPAETIKQAMENLDFNTSRLAKEYDPEEQEHFFLPFRSILGDIEGLREGINRLRRNRIKGKKSNIDRGERKRIIAEAVRLDMMERGKFLQGEEGGRFYYLKEDKQVYRLQKIQPLLYRLYDITENTEVGKQTETVLKDHTDNEGEEVKVRKQSYFDEDEKTLCIYDKDTHYFALDGEKIEKKPNGTNGIYFKSNQDGGKFEYIPKEKRELDFSVKGKISNDFKAGDCKLHDFLANQTNFNSTTNLSAEEQRFQLLLHIYAIPFGSLIPGKPIAVFTGQKGSTKSFTLKKLGEFFLGNNYRLRVLPDEEDFYVAVTHSLLTFFDNVDSSPPWFEDALAVVATQARVAKRKLYEDFEEAVRDPDTFLGIASRDVKFNRDDVMDRTLLFHVKRLNSYIRETDLLDPLYNYRSELWSDFLDNLNKVVAELRKDGLKNVQSNYRLADWACLAIQIAKALDYADDYDIDTIFDKMETERSAFTLKNEPLYQAIKKAKAGGQLPQNTWITALELAEKLQEADQHFSDSARTIGRKLSQNEKEYGEIFGMERKKQGNRFAYKFPKEKFGGKEPAERGGDGEIEKFVNVPTCDKCGVEIKEGEERHVEERTGKRLCHNCWKETGHGGES